MRPDTTARTERGLAGLAAVLFLCSASACGPRGDLGARDPNAMAEALADPYMLTYHPDLHVDITEMSLRPSGLLIRDLEPGQGDTLPAGRIAVVRYTGWLPDGTEFDSNRDGAPFSFEAGAGDVIPGWDEGLIGMRVGGRRQLVIPPALGYGEMGSGPIPPHAVLVFDVVLQEIR